MHTTTHGVRFSLPVQIGIIDIGAYSIRLEIFQVDNKNRCKILEQLSQPLNLGYDVFRKGVISPPKVNLLCSILKEFSHKLKEYGIKHHRTIATSAIRESFNRDILISRVMFETGLKIEVLEAQEEARMLFVLMREVMQQQYDFTESNAFIFAVGTGSLIIMFSENGKLRCAETEALGTVRFFDELGRTDVNPAKIIDLMESFELTTRFADALSQRNGKALKIIGLGAGLRALISIRNNYQKNKIVELAPEHLLAIMEQIQDEPPERLAVKYHIPDHVAISMAPSGHILNYFVKKFNCHNVIFPLISTRDALIADMFREEPDPFDDDIIASTIAIGEKFRFERCHAESVVRNSIKIFNCIQKTFGLSNRLRILLRVAALLHDVGRFVDTRKHHKHSHYLVSNMHLPGISEREMQVIAVAVRYHRKAIPSTSHPEYTSLYPNDKVQVCQLAAILRVADALDRAHMDKFAKMNVSRREDTLLVRAPLLSDLALEKLYLKKKSNLFREVYGLNVKTNGEL